MKTFLSLLLFLSTVVRAECQLRPRDRKIYSLSSPVTKVFEELGLLQNLTGISVFYPGGEKFKGEKIPGGIFLAPGKLKEMKDALIFYDQGQELRKLFRKQGLKAIEIVTRGQTPGETVSHVVKTLRPYLRDCDLEGLLIRVKDLEKRITKSMKERLKIVFFLGEVKEGRLPELVVVEDGLVLWLKRQGLVETYPTGFAYASWSGAILEELKKDHLLLGLKEGKAGVSGTPKRATLTFPGSLAPGLHQLEAWEFFLGHPPH